MKVHVTAILLLMSAGLRAEPDIAPFKLRWNNGESINGDVLEASADILKWKARLFQDPLELQWQVLQRIDQPLRPLEVSDPFTISLRDGSQIHGDLTEISDQAIAIKSQRHGDVLLKRAEVLSIRRLQGGNLVWAGPVGDVDWSNLADRGDKSGKPIPPPGMPRVTGGPSGALVLPFWNRSAAFSKELPVSIDLEFRVRSSIRPEFRLSLECKDNHPLDIETWDDEIVVTASDRFQLIRKLGAEEREVILRLCWDKKARRCCIFSATGELLTEWQTPELSGDGTTKMVLHNKGRDLTLEFLRLRKWDGNPLPKIDVKQPRIEMADGTVMAGQVLRVAAGSVHIMASGQSATQELPLASIDALIFNTDHPAVAAATLAYADGTQVSGSIVSIKDGAALLKTSFTEAALSTQLNGLRRLRQNFKTANAVAPEKPLNDLDKITVNDITLHGTLVASHSDQPRWRLIGGVADSMVVDEQRIEITRAFPPDAELSAAQALLYTTSGDVLPGNIRAVDKTGVDFESDIVALKKLPADGLEAIHFNPDTRVKIAGFTDPGWSIAKGDATTVVREKNKLNMEPGTSIRHADAMQANEIRFSYGFSGFTSVRLRMFCADANGVGATNVILYNNGDSIYSGQEITEGQMTDQIRTPVRNGKPVTVKLVVQNNLVEMHLNGLLAQKFTVAPSKRPGQGLIIEPASVWGNSMPAISLSDFTARSSPGRARLPYVDAEIKAQTLMVPRFRKDDPPRHALIAANGDVLRGEIESATQSHFKFRSGLETFTVPRDRVKAAMWLKQPLKETPPPVSKSKAMKVLDQRVQRRMRYSNGALSSLIGAIRRETPGIEIKLPDKAETRTFPFQFGDQTIGEALEEIANLFGLKYRVTGDATIVLEAAPSVAKNLITRSWWLKPDAFPKSASVGKTLEAKGVVFPGGASATWDAEARLLSATNTVENQNRLAEMLKTDLGGSLGSPTYWLLLTNGARLGLTIDKFDQDFITGHHPIYGACKFPISQVYLLRNSMPAPAAATGPLQSWRLAFAPEPVLPETGGQASAALGKEAYAFKLPLLRGGDFSLAQEKGKIVVLDFWATWCAPCTRSLPELIDVIAGFPADRVKLIGINQNETEEQVKRFVEARKWKLTVAMDAGQAIARKYGVDALPHTVIVGPNGKVVWVKTGYSPSGAAEIKEAILKLLAEPVPQDGKIENGVQR